MATRIKLKNSTVLDKAPTTADIVVGELALNCNSGSPAAYIQDSAGGIVQIAGVGSVNTPDATETVKGIAEIATTAEVSAGTNDSTIVTPAKLAAAAPAAQDLQSVCDEGATTTTGINSNGTITANLFSGSLPYGDLTGTPTIPTNNNQLTNGAGYYKSGDSPTLGAATFTGDVSIADKIVWTGDTNTAIRSSSADTITVETGGSERFRINNSGVTSSSFIATTAGTALVPEYRFATLGTGLFSASGTGDVAICTDETARLTVEQAGNVGIGTSLPDYNLTIGDGSSYVIQNLKAASDEFCEFRFGDTASAAQGKITYDNDTDSLRFTANASECLRIDSSGRLLVGASSAATAGSLAQYAKFVLRGDTSGSSGAGLINVARGIGAASMSSGWSAGDIIFSDNAGLEFGTIGFAADGTPSGSSTLGRFVIKTTASGATTPTERMRIDSSGNVGIGTDSPSQILELKAATPRLCLNGTTADSFKGIEFDHNGTTYGSITHNQGAGDLTISSGDTGYGYFINFKTDNTEAMRIDSSGNVGIGTDSPSTYGTLAVSGTGSIINLTASSGTSALGFWESSTSRFFLASLDGSHGLAFIDGDGSSERMRIDSSGRVGIGTDSPEEILHIAAASETVGSRDGVLLQSTSSAAADTGLPIVFTVDIGGAHPNYGLASIAGRKESGTVDGSDAAGYLQFATGNTGGAIEEKMRIDSSGNVGIGTSSPTAQLHVSTAAGGGAISVGGHANTQYQYINLGSPIGGEKGWQIGRAASTATMAPAGGFYIYDMEGQTTGFCIDTSGNIGIGTTSPSTLLHVGGVITAAGYNLSSLSTLP